MIGLSDDYTLRARVAPVILVLTPLILFAMTSVVIQAKVAAAAGIVGVAVLGLASQLGRDQGKKLEEALWVSWGGPPTVQKLRYRGETSPSVVRRHHEQVERVTQIAMPTGEQEAADPASADQAYEQAIASLRERTRDHSKFETLYAENINYGFRRNLLGLKNWGNLVALLTLIGCGLFVLATDERPESRLLEVAIPTISAVLALLVYRFIVTPAWVRVPADAYADRLLGATEQL